MVQKVGRDVLHVIIHVYPCILVIKVHIPEWTVGNSFQALLELC